MFRTRTDPADDVPLSIVLAEVDRREGRSVRDEATIEIAQATRDRIERLRGAVPLDAYLNIVLDFMPSDDLGKDYDAWRERAAEWAVTLPKAVVRELQAAQR